MVLWSPFDVTDMMPFKNETFQLVSLKFAHINYKS